LREKEGMNTLLKIPIILEKVRKEDTDKEILRTGVIAELDAINLYEQMAAMTRNNNIKKILLDIGKEEKTHVGEFLTLPAFDKLRTNGFFPDHGEPVEPYRCQWTKPLFSKQIVYGKRFCIRGWVSFLVIRGGQRDGCEGEKKS